MSDALIPVHLHASQWPDQIRAELRHSLRTRRINPKFLYESRRQAEHWLHLHEACSPARRDPDCQATYERAFSNVARTLTSGPVQIISLGCGSGEKELRLLELLPAPTLRSAFVAVDVSWTLALTARNRAARILPGPNCHALVCDLSAGGNLLPELDRLAGHTDQRIFTCFGVLPNFEPHRLLKQLAELLRPHDRLLLSANLAREANYHEHLRTIRLQYDNPLTRTWLFLLLADLGVEFDDGRFDCRVVPDPAWDPLARIAVDFVFTRPRTLILDDEEFRFERDDTLALFFSYRHTRSSVRGLLARHGIRTETEWITSSSEEGVFAGHRTSSSKLSE